MFSSLRTGRYVIERTRSREDAEVQQRGRPSANQVSEANHEAARTSCQSHRSRTPITATSTTFCNEGTRQALSPTVGAEMIEGVEELMMEGAEELIEEAQK